MCAVTIGALVPLQARAQRCDFDVEAILKLREAEIGAFAIWDGVHGDEDHDERYGAAVAMENANMYVAGTRGSLGQAYPDLTLQEIDRRGRVAWETKRKVKGLDNILSVHRYGDDYMVLARIQEAKEISSLWIGVFDGRGALRREKTFRHKNGSFVYGSVALAPDGKGLVMAASVEDKRSAAPRFSEFYRLNSKMQVISKRAFNPGPDNGLYSITPSKDGRYLATGYVNNARDRKTGWLLKVDERGGIDWQRQYPRGVGAELTKVAQMSDGSIAVLGTALPGQEDPLKAGWLMRVAGDNGEMQWQRYFTNDMDYTGKGLMVNKDDVMSVMIDAKPIKSTFAEEGEVVKDYARVVTLNPRGVVFDSQAYFQGEIADVHDFVLGPSGERIMVGTTQIAYQQENDVVSGDGAKAEAGKPIEKRSNEGWIIATPKVDSYIDPCKPKKERVLNSL